MPEEVVLVDQYRSDFFEEAFHIDGGVSNCVGGRVGVKW